MEKPADTSVLFNADCPVCNWEIGHYKTYAKGAALPIRFDGLEAACRWGLTEDQAARRLHVLADGQLLSGIPAFLALWREMPRYRWLARLVGLPGLRHLAAASYDYVLAPVIYRAHLRRMRRKA